MRSVGRNFTKWVPQLLSDNLEQARKKRVRETEKAFKFVRQRQTVNKEEESDNKLYPKKQLKFPPDIVDTTLQLDVILVSRMQVVLLELIVPWEDWVEEVFSRKKGSIHPLHPSSVLPHW